MAELDIKKLLAKYIMRYRSFPCPYCRKISISYWKRARLIDWRVEKKCSECGAVIKFASKKTWIITLLVEILLVIMVIVFWEIPIVIIVLVSAEFLIYYLFIVPLAPIKYESSLRYPERDCGNTRKENITNKTGKRRRVVGILEKNNNRSEDV